ncbi:MAG: hypothetical protein OJF47_003061 [Nitrospira sp.]|nr:MAG: hypothetical protein OJF47_003061 [Nitrospira sp.]
MRMPGKVGERLCLLFRLMRMEGTVEEKIRELTLYPNEYVRYRMGYSVETVES